MAVGDAADIGYQDQSYAPGPSAPTAEKPQSKLWFNDGIWWGSIFNGSTGRFEIYRLNTSTHAWTTTGTIIDARDSSHADTLWDSASNHLYVATAVVDGSDADLGVKVLRYTYDTGTKLYTLDTGFPVASTDRACVELFGIAALPFMTLSKNRNMPLRAQGLSTGETTLERCQSSTWSDSTKKNVLFFLIGPP